MIILCKCIFNCKAFFLSNGDPNVSDQDNYQIIRAGHKYVNDRPAYLMDRASASSAEVGFDPRSRHTKRSLQIIPVGSSLAYAWH